MFHVPCMFLKVEVSDHIGGLNRLSHILNLLVVHTAFIFLYCPMFTTTHEKQAAVYRAGICVS